MPITPPWHLLRCLPLGIFPLSTLACNMMKVCPLLAESDTPSSSAATHAPQYSKPLFPSQRVFIFFTPSLHKLKPLIVRLYTTLQKPLLVDLPVVLQ